MKKLFGTENPIALVLTFSFAMVGFVANFISVYTGDGMRIILIALIYVMPLLIEAIENLERLSAIDMIQFKMDQVAVVVGIIYLVMVASIPTFLSMVSSSVGVLLRTLLALPPGVFLVRKGYAIRIRFKQLENVARSAYSKT